MTVPLGAHATGPTGRWLRAAQDLEDDSTRADRAAHADIPSLRGTVLVAEDGVHNQRLITAYLQCTGAELKVVDNGELAVQEALAGDYDLVLMDIQMPVMDGATAITMLRAAGYGGPIVALTANVMRADIERYRDIGCDDVLAKPIDRQRLHDVLTEYLARGGTREPSNGDHIDAVVRRLAADFRADLPHTITTLREAMDLQDAESLRFIGHRIKGLCGSLGFPELSERAEPVERHIDAGRLDQALQATASLLEALQELADLEEATQP